MEKISVIVPAYNAEKYIERCVDSLCGQISSYNEFSFDYEIVVVNDGSKDSTLEILRRLEVSHSNLRVLDKPNGGAASARKYGIDNSVSDYLAFSDADDFVDPDWLISMYVFLKKYKADVSICMAYLNENESKPIPYDSCDVIEWTKGNVHKSFLEHKDLNGSLVTKLFKRELFDGLVWNFELKVFEDDLLIWQILYKVDRIVKFKIQKYHYIFTPNSLTRTGYDLNRFDSFRFFLERVVSDSFSMGNTKIKETALDFQYKWMVLLLSQHVISGNKDNEARDYMLGILSKGGIKRWRRILDLKRKIFVGSMILSSNLTYKIIQIIKQ